MRNDKSWYGIDLSGRYVDMFKAYLRHAGVYYEPSEAGTAVHFECHMTKEEYEYVCDFLREMNRIFS